MVSAYESVLMAHRMPYGEVARMMLMGTAERIGACFCCLEAKPS